MKSRKQTELKPLLPLKTRLTIVEAKKLGLLSKLRLPSNQQLNQSRSKYGNTKTVYNGQIFDSKKESLRAIELDFLQRVGVVKKWEPQPKFKFELNGQKICTYVADFKVEYPDGHIEIEDVKGFKTAIYRVKKKMLKAFYGIDIKEL